MKKLGMKLALACITVALLSCKKEKDETPAPIVYSGPITLDCFIGQNKALINHNLNGVDYIINCPLQITSGKFSIDTNVTIQFGTSGSLTIENDAYIEAKGKVNKPVVFQGTSNTAGSWGYIHIKSEDNRNRMDYCVLKDGGSSTFETSVAGFSHATKSMLFVTGRLALVNSSIENSEGDGIFYEDGSVITEFSGNSFQKNKGFPVVFYAGNIANCNFMSCTFSDNVKNYIALFSSSSNAYVSENTTINKSSIPYYPISDLTFGGNIVINEGVTMIMKSGSFLGNTNTGYFKINGTAIAPVTIKGESNSAGFWDGILVNSNNTGNEFNYLIISNGGNEPTAFTNVKANISVGSVAKAYLKINNSTSTVYEGCALAYSDVDGTVDNNSAVTIPNECVY